MSAYPSRCHYCGAESTFAKCATCTAIERDLELELEGGE